ncbi:MAG: helical backbone metal receptor [Dehalococcoidia bacterium]|nr:helical backbone metal receptor [Dehalococcoidia bacterium]
MSKRRIISLAPSNTEILFALGLADEVVGVTEFCNFPLEAGQKEKVGGFSTVDVDRVVSLHPDLVLATDFHEETFVPQLSRRGINVQVIRAKTVLDTPKCIAFIGEITDREEEASYLAQSIEGEIKAITEKIRRLDDSKKPQVCYLCLDDPVKIARAACPPNALIRITGGINIGKDFPQERPITLDEIANKDPEVIITPRGHGETVDLLTYVRNQTVLKETRACRTNRVHRVNADLICRPRVRAASGLGLLARYIHPELFGHAEAVE